MSSEPLDWSTPLPSEGINTYLIFAPDFESDSKRLGVREQHLDMAKKGHQTGRIVVAGATLKQDPATSTGSLQMTGSFLLARARSADEARAICMEDIYVKGGAWDPSKLQITPVIVANHN